MNNDINARRERVAAMIFAAFAAREDDESKYSSYLDDARNAVQAAEVFIDYFDSYLGSTEEPKPTASPSLLDVAKAVVEAWDSCDLSSRPFDALRAAIAREEVARG